MRVWQCVIRAPPWSVGDACELACGGRRGVGCGGCDGWLARWIDKKGAISEVRALSTYGVGKEDVVVQVRRTRADDTE